MQVFKAGGFFLKIWVDNDGCPRIVRDLVFAAAVRRNIETMVVANRQSEVPLNSLFKSICIPGGFDAADDYIAIHVAKGDLVITSDVPLAARIVSCEATGLSAHGEVFDRHSIGDQLSSRNLMQELRSGGTISGGPKAYGPAEKKRFADSLDRLLAKLSK